MYAEEMGDGGKKAQGRKWKEWSVILTGSQLVFYKDPTWALTLIAQISDTPAGSALPQDFTFLKPDELLSVKDAVAVHDISYDKVDRLSMSALIMLILFIDSIRTLCVLHYLQADSFSCKQRANRNGMSG